MTPEQAEQAAQEHDASRMETAPVVAAMAAWRKLVAEEMAMRATCAIDELNSHDEANSIVLFAAHQVAKELCADGWDAKAKRDWLPGAPPRFYALISWSPRRAMAPARRSRWTWGATLDALCLLGALISLTEEARGDCKVSYMAAFALLAVYCFADLVKRFVKAKP